LKKICCLLILAIVGNICLSQEKTVTTTTTTATTPEVKPVTKSEKNIEIVFVLDTTGSMSGLIDGAKTKIWNIVNEILQNQKGNAKVKIGLIGYRDKGDEYITKLTQLSENIDNTYSELMNFVADGGGDEPEDVRRALHEAVNNIQWSNSTSNKIIFLVGDAPPHEDYQDYPSTIVTAKKAKEKGIIINTIQCGNLSHTDKFWKEIAQYASGEYFAIPQDGGSYVMKTPYDEKLETLGYELDKKYIPYGRIKEQRAAKSDKIMKDTKISSTATMEAKADRAKNKTLNRYSYSSNDLIQAIENKKVNLSSLKQEELPEEMQKMSKDEQEKYVGHLVQERKKIKKEITKVSKEREVFIKENSEKSKDNFDASVSKALEKQIQ